MKRETISLNGIWEFGFDADFEFRSNDISKVNFNDFMAVPGAFDASPAYNGKRGVGFYRKTVTVPANRKARIYLGAVGMYCKVFADGEIIGEHCCGYTGFECEIPVSTIEKREIVVMAGNRFDFELCSQHEIFYDFYAYGGIFRDTELRLLPEGDLIEWVGVDTLDYKNGRLSVKITSSGTAEKLTITVDGNDEFCFDNVEFTDNKTELEITIPGISLWNPATPELHSLQVSNGNDSRTVQFGVRQVWTEGKKIIVNGESIKLLGYCRHEAHPQFGPALPLQQLVADLQLLRDLGCNFVRGSHYPQDQRFLSLCDQMGFLVFEESLSWGVQEKHCTDENYIREQLKQTEEMVLAGYNNPSVIMRGFLNEGASGFENSAPCYTALIKLIKDIDPTRLVTYASNHYMNDKFLDQVDIVSFNIYPGWYAANRQDEMPLSEIVPTIRDYIEKLDKAGLGDKPFIISEIGAGAIYGWRDPICAHWSEEYQEEYLKITCQEIVDNDNITGVALWQFCDCRTYRSAHALIRPRAFNNKGTLDEYRRPKLSYRAVKDIFTKASV